MFGCEVEGLVAAVAVLSAVLSVLAFAPSPPPSCSPVRWLSSPSRRR
ncbi:MAG: hypothetical protein QW566_03075 [Candidatus Jordarchaeales archaeon]